MLHAVTIYIFLAQKSLQTYFDHLHVTFPNEENQFEFE